MSQPESRLSRQIMTALRLKGWWCTKIHGSEFMEAGLPDIIVCAQGVFVGLEVKMPGKENNTSPRQDYVHGKIGEAGGHVGVVSSIEQATEIVQEALRDLGIAH